jgi:hypothetical protein
VHQLCCGPLGGARAWHAAAHAACPASLLAIPGGGRVRAAWQRATDQGAHAARADASPLGTQPCCEQAASATHRSRTQDRVIAALRWKRHELCKKVVDVGLEVQCALMQDWAGSVAVEPARHEAGSEAGGAGAGEAAVAGGQVGVFTVAGGWAMTLQAAAGRGWFLAQYLGRAGCMPPQKCGRSSTNDSPTCSLWTYLWTDYHCHMNS